MMTVSEQIDHKLSETVRRNPFMWSGSQKPCLKCLYEMDHVGSEAAPLQQLRSLVLSRLIESNQLERPAYTGKWHKWPLLRCVISLLLR